VPPEPPLPPTEIEETNAIGTPMTVAFEFAFPPAPPVPPAPPLPPMLVAEADPAPELCAAFVVATALAFPPLPPRPPPLPPFPPIALAVLVGSVFGVMIALASPPGPPSVLGVPSMPGRRPISHLARGFSQWDLIAEIATNGPPAGLIVAGRSTRARLRRPDCRSARGRTPPRRLRPSLAIVIVKRHFESIRDNESDQEKNKHRQDEAAD